MARLIRAVFLAVVPSSLAGVWAAGTAPAPVITIAEPLDWAADVQ